MDREQPKQYYIDKPIFEGAKNAVVECKVEGCEWHFAGPREQLKDVWNAHYRMYHSQETGIMEIRKSLRDSIWLPS